VTEKLGRFVKICTSTASFSDAGLSLCLSFFITVFSFQFVVRELYLNLVHR
jgi:hypothetical protein